MRCAQCGTAHRAGETFCQHCGASLNTTHASSQMANNRAGNGFTAAPSRLSATAMTPLTPPPSRVRRGCGPALIFVLVILSLCSGSTFGVVWFWIHFGGVFPQVVYTGQTGGITALAWSPDGTRIVSTNLVDEREDGTVQIWDARTGQSLLQYTALKSLNAVAWSPNGRYIAVSGRLTSDAEETPVVQIFNAATGKQVVSLRFENAYDVAWSPDSKYLATAGNVSGGSLAQVWDVSNGRLVWSENADRGELRTVAWSPDSKRLAAGGTGGTVQVWDALTGEHAFSYRGHLSESNANGDPPGQIIALAWSPDSQWVASADQDLQGDGDSSSDYSTVRIWQPFVGGKEHVFPISALALAWSPDGTRIVTVNEHIRVWDALSGDHLFYYGRGLSGAITTRAVGWSPDGRHIAVGSDDGEIQIWEPPDLSTFEGHAYRYDVIKLLLVFLCIGGLFLFFSLRPFARLIDARTQRAIQPGYTPNQGAQPGRSSSRFSLRALLIGLLLIGVGVILAWGMVTSGWDVHLFVIGSWYTSS